MMAATGVDKDRPRAMTSTTYLGLLLVGIQVLGFVAAIHAVLTVRTAQGAIAWATSLVFMPYLTLLPYLVFGRSRFDAYIEARRQANREMHLAAAELDWRPWVEEALAARQVSGYKGLKALVRMTRTPTLANNRVRLLVNGEASFEAMFKAISAARQVILVQFFIVRDDALGQRLQQLLLERAANGVEVFFLYDAIGSHALPHRFVERLRQGGVQVHGFSTGSGMLNRFQVNFRNHRKVVVVDGECGFVGGITSASSTSARSRRWRPGATPTWNCAGRRWRACRRASPRTGTGRPTACRR